MFILIGTGTSEAVGMSPYDPPGKRHRLVLESDNARDLMMYAFMAGQNPHIWVRVKPAVIIPEEKKKENK